VRVARVEGDLVNLQRSIFAVCHGFQPTTGCVHSRNEIHPPMLRVLTASPLTPDVLVMPWDAACYPRRGPVIGKAF